MIEPAKSILLHEGLWGEIALRVKYSFQTACFSSDREKEARRSLHDKLRRLVEVSFKQTLSNIQMQFKEAYNSSYVCYISIPSEKMRPKGEADLQGQTTIVLKENPHYKPNMKRSKFIALHNESEGHGEMIELDSIVVDPGTEYYALILKEAVTNSYPPAWTGIYPVVAGFVTDYAESPPIPEVGETKIVFEEQLEE